MTWSVRTSVVGGFCIGAAGFLLFLTLVFATILWAGGNSDWVPGILVIGLIPTVILFTLAALLLLLARNGWVNGSRRFSLLMVASGTSLAVLAGTPLQLRLASALMLGIPMLILVAIVLIVAGIIALFARQGPQPSN